MDFKEENIDRIFREGLKNFEVAPPPEVWEAVIQTRVHRKKRAFPVFRYAAAAVTFLLVVGSLYTIINKPEPGESVAGNLQDEQTIVQKSLQNDTQSIAPTGKDDIKSLEKVVQESIAPEKPLIAETQINIVEAKSKDISSDKVLQIHRPVNIRDETNTLLLAETYHPIESKSLSSFVDAKFIILNSKVAYSDKGLPVFNDFANDPIDHEIENQSGWSFGAKFSPLYTSRNVTMSMPDNFKEMYNNVEEGIIAFSGGLNFKYKPANRISIHAGLFYSRMGQKITDLVAYDVPSYIASTLPDDGKGSNNIMLNSSFGTVVVPEDLYIKDMTIARVIYNEKYSLENFDPDKYGLEGFDSKITQSFEYIEIPLLISYKVIDRVIDFQLLGGVSTNLLVGNNVFTEFDGQRISLGKTTDISKISYSSVVGFGIEYGFSDQLSFSIEPTFKYYLNSFSNGTRLHVHPFSIGLFSGVSYKF